jgi:hypothetical protein
MLWRWLTGSRPAARDAEAQRQARIARFRAEIDEAGARGDVPWLAALAGRLQEFGLEDEDVEVELERHEAWLDVLALASRARAGDLPVVTTNHRVVGADACYFIAPAFDVSRPHEAGKVLLTDRRVVFVGGGVTAAGWGRVSALDDQERDLVVVTGGAPEPRRYRFNTFRDAKRAAFVAQWLKDRSARRPGDPGGMTNA